MNKKLIINIIGTASIFAVAQVSATILTFEGLNLKNYGVISQDYGDKVDSVSDGIGNYREGTGFTPNISLSYKTTDSQRNIVGEWIKYWSNEYGDLIDVAFAEQNGHFAEITLSPEKGYRITLNGFDMAGWKNDHLLDTLQVLDKDGVVLWDAGVDTIHGIEAIHDSFSPKISSDSEITILWGKNWNTGIDNIDFNQSLTHEIDNCIATYNANGLLDIPCINITSTSDSNTVYQAKLQAIGSSNPLSFELKETQLQEQSIENKKCLATYSTDNLLIIPCVSVSDSFSGIIKYHVEMQLIPLSRPLAFELKTVEKI